MQTNKMMRSNTQHHEAEIRNEYTKVHEINSHKDDKTTSRATPQPFFHVLSLINSDILVHPVIYCKYIYKILWCYENDNEGRWAYLVVINLHSNKQIMS